jgi:CRISPR-associated endonuclease Csn1
LYKKAPFPISKVTRKESGEKMEVKGKYVEGDKGTNMFFVINENIETGKREFYTPPLFSKAPEIGVIDRLANQLPIAENRDGYKNIILSPNDLVYVPDCDSNGCIIEDIKLIDWANISQEITGKIYKMISSNKGQCFFIPFYVSAPLIPTVELGAKNKSESSWDDKMIKKICVKLYVDRLGNIKPA